jgi:hypothetical protein
VDISSIFVWIHATAFATAIRESSYLFPWIESVHVLAITVVVGSIAVVDGRLLGVTSMNRSVASLASEVLPLTWIAFLAAVLTGASLFASHATGYAANLEFRMKMILLVLAGINMMTFHGVMGRATANWDESGVAPWQGRVAGSISLVLWVGIVAFGRWIGFSNVR